MARRRAVSEPLVLGTQVAAANAADVRHQGTARGPSPLAGLTYRADAGEYDLYRFVDSATDDRIAAAVAAMVVVPAVGRVGRCRCRSVEQGVAPVETTASIQWLRDPLMRALEQPL